MANLATIAIIGRMGRDAETRLCACGCGRPTKPAKKNDASNGRVKGQPQRYLLGHQGRKQSPLYTIEDRGYPTPCWTWNYGKTGNGYGLTTNRMTGRGRILAHRFMFEEIKGRVPADMELDHLCRHRDCVNPEHLEPVPSAINVQRGSVATLNEEQVREIRSLWPSISQRAIAERYGITARHVWDVIHRRSWKDAA